MKSKQDPQECELRQMLMDQESILPPRMRGRLYELFGQIEREFEQLYAENLSLREKIEILKERLELAELGSEKPDGAEIDSGAKQASKKSGNQISQRLKLTYKTSTSKLVSSFRAAHPGSQQVREFRGHKDGVWDVACSSYNQQIIGTASADNTACIWWTGDSSCHQRYTAHTGSVNSVRFHPTQDLVITASGDQTAHAWRVNVNLPPSQRENTRTQSSGEDEAENSEKEDAEGADSCDDKAEPAEVSRAERVYGGHAGVVIAADWLYGGARAITASWDRSANIYDTETAELLTSLTGHDQELTNVTAHPSQQLVVTSSKDTTFRLWDLRDPSMKVNVFQGHTQHVTTAVFTVTEKIVSGSDDRTVKVWDLKNMRSPLTTIRTDSAVNRLSVSSSQHIIAIPQDNRQITLFHLQGARFGRLHRNARQGHTKMVCATAWGSEEQGLCNLFSCDFGRKVIGWNVNLIKE